MRRFTRLTNGFSTKIENHIAMVAIHAAYYNFARIHKTLGITPAMAAGLSDDVRRLEEIVIIADSYMPKPGKRGPYKRNRYNAGNPMKKSGWRMLIEIGFIVFLFYSNLLMGEFEHSGMGQKKGLIWALSDVFTLPNVVIAVVAATIGYILIEFLRTRF